MASELTDSELFILASRTNVNQNKQVAQLWQRDRATGGSLRG